MSTKVRNIQSKPATTSGAQVRFEQEINRMAGPRKIKHLLRVMATVEVVTNEGDKAIVASAIREGKQLLKQVSVARKAITTPLQEQIRSWIAKEKELVAPVEEAIQHADELIQQFNARVAAQQQAVLDRIAEEERTRLQAEDGDTEVIRQQSEFRRQIAVAQHSTGSRRPKGYATSGRLRYRTLRTSPAST